MTKFCSKCGTEVQESSKFCTNCGNDLSAIAQASEVKVATESKPSNTNGLAIAGFVISLVSLLCCGGTSWLGLIFSIIGLVESKKKNGSGKGLAIAGIIISVILLFLLIALYALYAIGAYASIADELYY